MKHNGIVRQVDNLGRIVVPVEYRRILGIELHDEVETLVRGKEIIVRKFKAGCAICGNTEGLFNIVGKEICMNCITTIKSCELIRHG